MNFEDIHDIDLYVGDQIRAARKALRWSQTKLAVKCGVSFQQLQKYETGKNRVAASRLHDISVILEKPITFFFPGNKDGARNG